MITFNLVAAVTRPIHHLSMAMPTGFIIIIVLLSGCQPDNSLSTDQQNNAQGSNDQFINDDAISTVVEEDSFSDIVPTYVEGIADAPADVCQNETVVNAFKAQQSDRQVKGCGIIIKALPDDNEGSRHQKILVALEGVSPQQTVLLVHNIDLAPRVADVSKGTSLSFYGEYVYNSKGGLVHWTHHDPAARHQGGWIDSNGVRYQ